MAKRVKGHRANKPNDSFGTVNDDTLYRGKYRDEVYEEEDDETEETVEAQADPEEATPQEAESFVAPKQEAEHDYKKRYDDLKKHYDAKVSEFKTELDGLKQQMHETEVPANMTTPKTMEELEEFKQRYPDVFDMVQTVSSIQTEAQVSELRQELGTIKEREANLKKQSAYKELLSFHSDFDTIKEDEVFLNWLGEQPASIAEGITKNNTDAKLAARVIDLYKADAGLNKKPSKKKSPSAAEAVTKPVAREVSTSKGEGRIWKASEIGKMKPWEFEKAEAELDAARAEGRIDYNN